MNDVLQFRLSITVDEDNAFTRNEKQNFLACMSALALVRDAIIHLEQQRDGWDITYSGTFEDAYSLKQTLSSSTVHVTLEVK